MHFFNTFFYKKLSQRHGKPEGAAGGTVDGFKPNERAAHDRVKKWTKHVDIFSKVRCCAASAHAHPQPHATARVIMQDFVFVPVHSGLHWSLVIICHPGALLPQAAAADQEVIDIDGGPASAPPQVVDPEPTAPEAQEDVKAAAPSAPGDPSVMDVDAAKPGADDIAKMHAAAAEPPPPAAPVISPFFLHLDSLSGSGHSGCAFSERRGAILFSDAIFVSSHAQRQAAAVSRGGVGASCALHARERACPLRHEVPQLLHGFGGQI